MADPLSQGALIIDDKHHPWTKAGYGHTRLDRHHHWQTQQLINKTVQAAKAVPRGIYYVGAY